MQFKLHPKNILVSFLITDCLLKNVYVLKHQVLCKINKTIGLQNLSPRAALITLHKAFVRPHLDYGDIIYDQAHSASFHKKLEPLQYNACLGITRAIRGSSREKLYQELGFESLQNVIVIGNYVISTRSVKRKVRINYSI